MKTDEKKTLIWIADLYHMVATNEQCGLKEGKRKFDNSDEIKKANDKMCQLTKNLQVEFPISIKTHLALEKVRWDNQIFFEV